MQDKIYIKQWLELKPYENQTLSDSYYLKLSNIIKSSLDVKNSLVLSMYINADELNLMCCFLTAYFEDIISGTNIWNSFVRVHSKLYNKNLPFFNSDEYFDGEINEQDIRFLIWYFLNTVQEDKFISQENTIIVDMALIVFEILDNEYESAPENKLLKTFYTIDENESDFYKVRQFIETILIETYLFFPDTALKQRLQENEIIKKYLDDDNLLMFLRDGLDSFIHGGYTRLLSFKGKEWAAEILGAEHPVSADLLNMSQRIVGYFLYKGQDESDIFLEYVATGKEFKLIKKSYDYSSNLEEIDSVLIIGIVCWRNEWWFSGASSQFDFNADIVLNERNSLESRRRVNFLDNDSKKIKEVLKQQFDAFLKFNNRSPIAFLPSDEIGDFNKKFIDYFNNSLNISKKENTKAKKRLEKDGYFGNKVNSEFNYSDIADSGLIFFNPKSGIEIALDVNSAFPLKNNFFYDAEKSEDDLLHLLLSEEMSTELVMYCIDNCKANLPFFTKDVGKKYLDDIDFLLRFWKRESYHSTPSVTLV